MNLKILSLKDEVQDLKFKQLKLDLHETFQNLEKQQQILNLLMTQVL